MTPNTLLELHSAAAPFIRPGALATTARRQRLREALAAALREAGLTLPPPDLLATPDEALDALRALLRRCVELHVPWRDLVAIVNREEAE